MTLIDDDRPDNLMQALAAVRNSGCNMQARDSAIAALHGIGQQEVASWLERHQESYSEIVTNEFSQWLEANSDYRRESIAQDAAKATGLGMPEDSFS